MKTLRGEIAAANSRDVADIGLDVTDPAAGSRYVTRHEIRVVLDLNLSFIRSPSNRP